MGGSNLYLMSSALVISWPYLPYRKALEPLNSHFKKKDTNAIQHE